MRSRAARDTPDQTDFRVIVATSLAGAVLTMALLDLSVARGVSELLTLLG